MFVKLYYSVYGKDSNAIKSSWCVIPVNQIVLMSTHFTTMAENVFMSTKDYYEGNFKSNELFYEIKVSDDTKKWVEHDLHLSYQGYELYITKEDYDKIYGIEYYDTIQPQEVKE